MGPSSNTILRLSRFGKKSKKKLFLPTFGSKKYSTIRTIFDNLKLRIFYQMFDKSFLNCLSVDRFLLAILMRHLKLTLIWTPTYDRQILHSIIGLYNSLKFLALLRRVLNPQSPVSKALALSYLDARLTLSKLCFPKGLIHCQIISGL